MAEGKSRKIPKSHLTQASKNDKDSRQAELKLLVFVSNVKKDDVTITYPQNIEEDLVVKVKDEIFYSERLPDSVIPKECKLRKIHKKKGQCEIEIILTKETHGMWLNKWHIER